MGRGELKYLLYGNVLLLNVNKVFRHCWVQTSLDKKRGVTNTNT